jgi:hypothetical protein
MALPRALMPTDLLALVSYGSRNFDNRAWPRERLGADASSHPLGLIVDKLRSLGRDRCAWVSIEHQRLRGLVAVRPRGGRSAWEIDRLMDAAPGSGTEQRLIETALAGVGSNGGEKLFVRLAAGDSELLEAFHGTGFASCREETLYTRSSAPSVLAVTDLQAALPSDDYPIFRLYTATTPEPQRRVEAVTYAEWHAAQERRWLKHGGVELVQHRDGRLSAWARAAKLPWGTLVDLVADAGAAREADAIVAAATSAVGANGGALHVLVPRTDETAARRLEDAGFTAQREFISLVRRTTVLKALPARLPAVAPKALRV